MHAFTLGAIYLDANILWYAFTMGKMAKFSIQISWMLQAGIEIFYDAKTPSLHY